MLFITLRMLIQLRINAFTLNFIIVMHITYYMYSYLFIIFHIY